MAQFLTYSCQCPCKDLPECEIRIQFQIQIQTLGPVLLTSKSNEEAVVLDGPVFNIFLSVSLQGLTWVWDQDPDPDPGSSFINIYMFDMLQTYA